jgi:hypothetical protein
MAHVILHPLRDGRAWCGIPDPFARIRRIPVGALVDMRVCRSCLRAAQRRAATTTQQIGLPPAQDQSGYGNLGLPHLPA